MGPIIYGVTAIFLSKLNDKGRFYHHNLQSLLAIVFLIDLLHLTVSLTKWS